MANDHEPSANGASAAGAATAEQSANQGAEGSRSADTINSGGGDIAQGNINKNQIHNYYGEGTRDPWRVVRVSAADLRLNRRVFVDLTSSGLFQAASEPLVLISGASHSGRYATALACAREWTRARRREKSAAKVRVQRIDDIDCRLELSLEDVCRRHPGSVVIVRDVDRGRAANSRLTPGDWSSLLSYVRSQAESHRCQVILTVEKRFASEAGRRLEVVAPRWGVPQDAQERDRLLRLFRRHGRAFLRCATRDAARQALTRARAWLGDVRQSALATARVTPGRVAALWDQFGADFLADRRPDQGAVERLLGGSFAQAAWFEKLPFVDRVALVLVWLFAELDVSELLETVAAVAAQASATLHEDGHPPHAGGASSLAEVSRRLMVLDDLERLQLCRPAERSRIEFRDPALTDAIAARAADYAFLLGPLARALPGTVRAERQSVITWREAFGRALGKLGVHRKEELQQYLETLWQVGQLVELREALCELCRTDSRCVAYVASFLNDGGRLDVPAGAHLALRVLPALVRRGVATSGAALEHEESGEVGADPALRLAREVVARVNAWPTQEPLMRDLTERVRAHLIQVLDGIVRSIPHEASAWLREGVLSGEAGDRVIPNFNFLRLLARAVARAFPAALRADQNWGFELLADLLRSSTSNELAKNTLCPTLLAVAKHTGADKDDPFRALLQHLAWNPDMRVVHSLRFHITDVLAAAEAEGRSRISVETYQRLAATRRDADAAAGLVVRSTQARVVIAGRFRDQEAERWRDRLMAWLAPHAQIEVVDTRDLDSVRAALTGVRTRQDESDTSATPPTACPLVYLVQDADVDADVLALSPMALVIGPDVPAGLRGVTRVRLAWGAPRETRLAALNTVLAWWSRHVERQVEDGGCADDGSASLRAVVRLSRESEAGEAALARLVQLFAQGAPEERIQARAALLRRFWHTVSASASGEGGPTRSTELEAEWRRARAALAGLPQRHWDELWLAALHAGAPRYYVKPGGNRNAAVVVRLVDAEPERGPNGALRSTRCGVSAASGIFTRVQHGLAERGFEVHVREEPPGRRTLARRSLELLLEPMRASECAVVVLLGGRASLGDGLLDLDDWRAWLGNRLVAVDLPANLARCVAQPGGNSRANSAPSARHTRPAEEAERLAERVAGGVLRQVEQQLALRPRHEPQRSATRGV